MRKSGFSRKWRLVLIGAIAFFLLIVTAPMSYSQNPGNLQTVTMADLSLLAQTPTPQISPSPSVSNSINIQEATVNIDGKKLFVIKAKLGEVPPKERARTTEEKIIRIAQDSSLGIESIKRVDLKTWQIIQANDVLIMAVGPDDAKAANTTTIALADRYIEEIQKAITQYREIRTQENLIQGIIQAITATFLLLLTLFILNRFLPFIVNKIGERLRQQFSVSNNQPFGVMAREQMAKILAIALNAIRVFSVVFIFYIYIPFVLSCFPATKSIGVSILSYFWQAVNLIFKSLIGYLPNLFIIALIVVIAYYSIRFLRFFFEAVKRGRFVIRGFYPEWTEPTFNIIKLLIISLSAILIFPYLPASSSSSFQGVSIFIGAIFTFGSTAIIGNIISGIVLIYTRAFQLTDIIQVNSQRGKVIEKTMLSTRIMTPDNEVITIPNASLLVSDITNYSAVIRDQHQPLLLKTTITLGYDLPWRKVHQVLINAAKQTEDILSDPEPFVLQTSLDDFYVSYTLKAFTNYPDKMPLIYSALHQNIQDKCNEADIEIMSPHYSNLRDGNQTTIPTNYLPDNYQAPGFHFDSHKT